MTRIMLEVRESKNLRFLRELLSKFDFVQIVSEEAIEEPTHEEVLDGIREAVNDMNQMIAGKKPTKTLNQLLDEF